MPSIDWNRRWAKNLIQYIKGGIGGDHYGDQWGNPEKRNDLIQVRRKFLSGFVNQDTVALEIGSGGGRWTQYLLPCKEVICVEMNPEMFGYIRARFNNPPHLNYVVTHGSDLPSVPHDYVDFLFSFGVFVHIDFSIIAEYMKSIYPVMKQGGRIVLQFSNKKKPEAAKNPDFSDNSPERMQALFQKSGFRVDDVDDDLLIHSTIILGTKV